MFRIMVLAGLALLGAASRAAAPLVDDDGQAIALTKPAQRIVSLSPGATAMLFAAGASSHLVGTADFSDEPAAARAIPRIGDSQGYDLERILALRPDIVVVWSGGTNASLIERLRRAGLPVYRHRVARLADVPGAVQRLGRLAGTGEIADVAAAELNARVVALRANAGATSVAAPAGDSARVADRTVLIQIWDRPVYTVGGTQLLSDAVEQCGYRNVFDDLRDAGPAVSVEAVLTRDPAVILAVAPDERQAEVWLQQWRAMPALRAVRDKHLLTLSDQRFSRLGPAVIDATEALCARLKALR
jgi:iron complex transport system substrate-binding protein